VSLWLDILGHAVVGNTAEAYRLLNFELPVLLRSPEVSHTGEWRYIGPVPKMVRIFFASLPEADRGMAKSRAEDFVDYVCDLILAKVRRTVSLVEFCRMNPDLSADQIAEGFIGWDGLKLGVRDRELWVQKHLRSMSALSINLRPRVMETIEPVTTNVDDLYGYHELALVNKWRADLSWKDFKAQEEIDSSYLSVTGSDAEDEPGVAEESFDYGALSTARVVLNLSPVPNGELSVDLNRIGERLTSDLLELLENFHAEKPSDGYLPIAWHNVWWTITSKYEEVPFDLSERDPFCEVDRALAEYIDRTYPDVIKPSRLNIFRRRTRFQDTCLERAQSVLIAWSETGSIES
jgi:hypothetical protein